MVYQHNSNMDQSHCPGLDWFNWICRENHKYFSPTTSRICKCSIWQNSFFLDTLQFFPIGSPWNTMSHNFSAKRVGGNPKFRQGVRQYLTEVPPAEKFGNVFDQGTVILEKYFFRLWSHVFLCIIEFQSGFVFLHFFI